MANTHLIDARYLIAGAAVARCRRGGYAKGRQDGAAARLEAPLLVGLRQSADSRSELSLAGPCTPGSNRLLAAEDAAGDQGHGESGGGLGRCTCNDRCLLGLHVAPAR